MLKLLNCNPDDLLDTSALYSATTRRHEAFIRVIYPHYVSFINPQNHTFPPPALQEETLAQPLIRSHLYTSQAEHRTDTSTKHVISRSHVCDLSFTCRGGGDGGGGGVTGDEPGQVSGCASAFFSVSPLDIFKETSGDFPAVFVADKTLT